MKMKTLAAVLLLCAAPLSAQKVDDSDLSGGGYQAAGERFLRLELEGRLENRAMVFPVGFSRPPLAQSARTVTGSVLLADRSGKDLPARLAKVRLVGSGAPESWVETDAQGRFTMPLSPGLSGRFRARVSLDNRYWAFSNPANGSSYEWESPAFSLPDAGLDLGALRPAPSSENAKIGVLHLTYLEALDFLDREGDTQWWDRTLTINYPGQGDFFQSWSWSLDLTNPVAWDVVLHELGHAVMAGSMRIESAGGSHKIDECYSPALAWSEGWATFFAAAVRIPRDDADAKFEFLVPRRAPIRIENVPADVCKGQASEWRVSAGLWDLFDTHADGRDDFALSFSRQWKSLRGQSMGSMGSAWALIAKDLNPLERRAGEDALIQNTLLPERKGLAVTLPQAPFDWLVK